MFNQEHFETRHKALLSLVRVNNADVVCLQEVLSPIVDWLVEMLKDMYSPVITKLQPLGRSYGELIFVKNGLDALEYNCVDLEGKMGRALQHVKVSKDNVIYSVMTFHLESMNCQKVRRMQLAKICLYIKELDNVICCGDTNQTAKEECKLSDNILDAWEQTDGKLGEHTYYSGRFWDGDRKHRYDKIWYSDDLSLAGFGVLGNNPIAQDIWISDHDGLYGLFIPN